MIGICLRRVLALSSLASFIANLIIVGGAENTSVCRSIPLKLPIYSNFAIRRVKIARPRLFIDKTDYISLSIRMEFPSTRPLCISHSILLLLIVTLVGLHAHTSSLLLSGRRRLRL